jgi:hypothetical protein
MRSYFTATVAVAVAILHEGFTDFYEFAGMAGAWLINRALGANEGFEGPVTLCPDVPDEEFRRYEAVEDGGGPGYRMALVPAAALNRLGRPAVYDHAFAGRSRRESLRAHGDEQGRRRRGRRTATGRSVGFHWRTGAAAES